MPVFRITPDLLANEKVPARVVVANGTDYPSILKKAIESEGGMASIVKNGSKVVIKPNIGWDRNVEQGANTHPLIVKTLAEMALLAGAAQVMVFDRTCNEERRCYANSGIKDELETIRDKRIKCVHIDDRKFVPVQIEKGKSLDEWSFYRDALEADCYINVPVAKHHALAGLTIGLKNIMGVIGGHRGRIHWDMAQNLADLNTVIKPTLNVVDATRILTRNGPQGGNVKDVKKMDTIIVSKDIVAADAYATTLFGKKPEDIDAIRKAWESGLGEMDLFKMNIVKLS